MSNATERQWCVVARRGNSDSSVTVVDPGPMTFMEASAAAGDTNDWDDRKHATFLPCPIYGDPPEHDAVYTSFGRLARTRCHDQAQYASRAVDGRHGYPLLGDGLRFLGTTTEYYDLWIHEDDREEFVARWEKHQRELSSEHWKEVGRLGI